eukprot:scaffold29417_cov128-Skeletonema_marinoi.AAC.1
MEIVLRVSCHKSTLVQAKLMSESAPYKERLAYSIQLQHPLSNSQDTSTEMWDIRNNSTALPMRQYPGTGRIH